MQKSGGWARYMLQYAFNAFKQIKIIKCRNFCCGILWSRLISPLCKSGCSASSLAGGAGASCRDPVVQKSSAICVNCYTFHFYSQKWHDTDTPGKRTLLSYVLTHNSEENLCRSGFPTRLHASNEKRTAVSVSLLPVYTHVFVNNSDVCCSFYCCRQLSIVKTSVCPALSNTH